jgi:predicted solute-binding protein
MYGASAAIKSVTFAWPAWRCRRYTTPSAIGEVGAVNAGTLKPVGWGSIALAESHKATAIAMAWTVLRLRHKTSARASICMYVRELARRFD